MPKTELSSLVESLYLGALRFYSVDVHIPGTKPATTVWGYHQTPCVCVCHAVFCLREREGERGRERKAGAERQTERKRNSFSFEYVERSANISAFKKNPWKKKFLQEAMERDLHAVASC
jgi:hypothetical protein